jgi:hypothetical protein
VKKWQILSGMKIVNNAFQSFSYFFRDCARLAIPMGCAMKMTIATVVEETIIGPTCFKTFRIGFEKSKNV